MLEQENTYSNMQATIILCRYVASNSCIIIMICLPKTEQQDNSDQNHSNYSSSDNGEDRGSTICLITSLPPPRITSSNCLIMRLPPP